MSRIRCCDILSIPFKILISFAFSLSVYDDYHLLDLRSEKKKKTITYRAYWIRYSGTIRLYYFSAVVEEKTFYFIQWWRLEQLALHFRQTLPARIHGNEGGSF